MADQLKLQIVTPESQTVVCDVDEVVLPSLTCSMGVLAGHAPLLAQLEVGEISYRVGGERRFLAVSGGFAEVQRDAVSILAETAEPAEEIDIERAKRARQAAEAPISREGSDAQFEAAQVKLKRALNRISIHGRTGV